MFAATTASPPTTQRTGQLDADGWPGGGGQSERWRGVGLAHGGCGGGNRHRGGGGDRRDPAPRPFAGDRFRRGRLGGSFFLFPFGFQAAPPDGNFDRNKESTLIVYQTAVEPREEEGRVDVRWGPSVRGLRPFAEWEPHHAHFVREEGTRSSKVSITPPRFGRTNAGVTERLMGPTADR